MDASFDGAQICLEGICLEKGILPIAFVEDNGIFKNRFALHLPTGRLRCRTCVSLTNGQIIPREPAD